MTVHNETTALGKSLQLLVQSRSYKERRQLMDLIGQAMKEALATKDLVMPGGRLELTLYLTSVRFSSVSQLEPFDPSTVFIADPMRRADTSLIDFGSVIETINSSEIDYRTLKLNIIEALKIISPISIAGVLDLYPATQGLGSVMGLIHLVHRHGQRGTGHETVSWDGLDGVRRSSRIDTWYFVKERVHEFY
jgi:hypothetical protein